MNAAIALTILVTLGVIACSDGDGGTDPVTTGTISVTVRADDNTRSGVTVERFAPGSSTAVETTLTSPTGIATFSDIEPGSWDVEVVVPGGLALEPGETARKTVTVTAGATAATSFDLVDEFDGEIVEAQEDLTFSRPSLVISAGTQVRWVNVSTMLHTVTPEGHSEWTSASLGSNGSTFTHTFDTPGTYEYFCQPHEAQNMRGTVTVN